MERQLNEQWVLEINGVKHMVKAVEGICIDCFLENGSRCTRSDECPAGDQGDYIIKDLGILNDDGLLPCPFCSSDVNIGKSATLPGGCIMLNFICTNCDNQVQVSSDSVQHCVDAFNRRA